ncbi:MAG: DUF6844 domain-containing protein [Oligosphaeraceae bacterium]
MSFLALSCALTLCAQEAEPADAGEETAAESPVVQKTEASEEALEEALEEAAGLNEDLQAAGPSSREMMDDCFEEYARERGFVYGMPTPQGVTYQKEVASVKAGADSPNFVKARTMAFERAFQDGVARMVMDFAGKEVVTACREYFRDGSDDIYDETTSLDDAARRITDKAAMLTEKELDAALVELGVSPEELTRKSVTERRNIFTDRLVKKAVKKAVGDSSGIVPVCSFECVDQAGGYSVGVVFRFDQKSREIARCLAKKVRPPARTPGAPVDTLLPPRESLVNQFGVRVVIDEEGMPAILSFAQYGVDDSADARRLERNQDAALRQAESLADQQITLFVNSSIQVENVSETGEEDIEDVLHFDNGEKYLQNVVQYVDRLRNTSTRQGSDSLAGRRTLVSRILTHPSGHKVAMVVRMWSFRSLDEVKNTLQTPRNPPRAPARKTGVQEGPAVRKGHTYDF